MSFLKKFLILIIIPFTLSFLCTNKKFVSIPSNTKIDFKIGYKTEACYEYSLNSKRNKISLVFSEINSATTEVLLYKSKSDISIKNDTYQNYYNRFLIYENSIKEIDLKDFEENLYIIIREENNSDRKIFEYNFILYEPPILLKEGKPISMKYFISNYKYEFIFISNKNLTLVYSTKIKSKKYINIEYNNHTLIERQIDESDHIFYLENKEKEQKYLYITIEDTDEHEKDQEFSLVVYEKGKYEFFEINKNEIINKEYINLNKGEEKQKFLFYYKLEKSTKANTINFRFDSYSNIKGYINIDTGFYHSSKELNQEEFQKYFNFEYNKFPIEYELNSDNYKKIYFQDSDTSFPYRYIYFKIEILKLENYYSPKNIIISIGEENEEINLIEMNFNQVKIIKKEIKSNIPTYFKLNLDTEVSYVFYSPFPNITKYIKGDLIIKDEKQNIRINKEYFIDKNEIFILSNISEFTVDVYSNEGLNATFYIEKVIKEDLYVRRYMRSDDPINIVFEEDDCKLNKKKYLLGIYDKDIYKSKPSFLKYWNSLDGEMEVYYRNNIYLEGESLFPCMEKYLQKKGMNIYIENYIDFFTFTCSKKGTLSIRSVTKQFNETKYKIRQNTINTIKVGKNIIVLMLTTPWDDYAEYLNFAFHSLHGEKVRIFPDSPELCNETIVEGDNTFKLKIDLNKFKEDQLVFKAISTVETKVEVIEVIPYNFTQYSILRDEKMTNLTDNNFVKFINKNTKKIQVTIKGLNNIPFSYGIFKLFTDDIDFLPMAYQFKNSISARIPQDNIILDLNNTFYGKNEDNKKYLAFIFSIPKFEYYDFEAQVIEIFDKNYEKEGNNTLIFIIVAICVILIVILIIIFIIFFILNKKENNQIEMDIQNIDSQPLDSGNKHIDENND